MQRDPPSLLIMCPLSHLRSINDKDKLNDVETGTSPPPIAVMMLQLNGLGFGCKIVNSEMLLSRSEQKRIVRGKKMANIKKK